MTVQIVSKTFREFKESVANWEGIVLLGCGGSLEEWIDGVTQSLVDNEVTTMNDPEKLFNEFIKLKTTGGRTDLALVFRDNAENLSIGRMAMWRLQFGDCSWISDYLVNYAGQHGFTSLVEVSDDYEEE